VHLSCMLTQLGGYGYNETILNVMTICMATLPVADSPKGRGRGRLH
jgi:hypothetical protein